MTFWFLGAWKRRNHSRFRSQSWYCFHWGLEVVYNWFDFSWSCPIMEYNRRCTMKFSMWALTKHSIRSKKVTSIPHSNFFSDFYPFDSSNANLHFWSAPVRHINRIFPTWGINEQNTTEHQFWSRRMIKNRDIVDTRNDFRRRHWSKEAS